MPGAVDLTRPPLLRNAMLLVSQILFVRDLAP